MGEVHLAEIELRGRALFDPDEDVRRAAWRAYIQRAQARGDALGLERALATRLLDPATPAPRLSEASLALAQLLLAEGRADFALLLATASGSDAGDSSETVLLAAYRLRWWATFDRAVEQLASADRRHFWRGMRALKRGRHREAERHFRASAAGRRVLERLQAGRRILRQLEGLPPGPPDAADGTGCRAVIDAWRRWQAEGEGPWLWRDEPDLVRACPTTAVVYSRSHDLYAQYYGARPDIPLEMQAEGPVTLRIDARPLHALESDQPIDDWLQIVDQTGRTRRFPIRGNRVSRELTLIGREDRAPGQRFRAELPLGPGHHTLRIAGEASELLVRVRAARPALPLPVLPPLTPTTVRAARAGVYGRAARRQAAGGVPVEVIAPGCGCLPICAPFSPPPVCAIALGVERGLPCGSDDQPASAARRSSSRHTAAAAPPTPLPVDRPAEMRQRATAVLAAYANTGSRGNRQASAGRTGRNRQAASFADTPRQRMIALLYRAEHQRASRLRCAAEATALASGASDAGDLRRLAAAIVGMGEWIPFQQFQSSAGVQGVTLAEWSPESRRLRVRKALMGRSIRGDYLVAGTKRLRVRVELAQGTSYRAVLEMPRISYLPLPPLEVCWQIDGRNPETVRLEAPGSRQTVHFTLGAGAHTFELWCERPFANQFVLVTLYEAQTHGNLPAPDGTSNHASVRSIPALPAAGPHVEQHRSSAPSAGRLARVFEQQRLYQAATCDEPVVFTVEGPAVLRIDEKLPEGVSSRVVAVTEPRRTFSFRPQRPEAVRLIRVMQLDFQQQRATPPVFRPLLRAEPVWEPWLAVWDAETFGRLPLSGQRGAGAGAGPRGAMAPGGDVAAAWADQQRRWCEPLRWRDDATWSLGAGWTYRRNLEEFSRTSAPDRFGQVDGSRYTSDASAGSYGRLNLLARFRESAGATLGAVQDKWWSFSPEQLGSIWRGDAPWRDAHEPPRVSSLRLHARGSFYLQRPGDPIPPGDNDLEWSGMLQARISQHRGLTLHAYHIPSALVLGRVLSMDRNRYAPGNVDQDIFTQYKRNHPAGLRLSDTFAYQPTVDLRWWVRPRLFTNEDFDVTRPDNVSLRFGCAQLVGPLQCDLSYRITRYYRDRDRRRDSDQQVLYFDAIFEQWRSAGFQWQIHGVLRQDTTGGGTTALVHLEAFESRGRGYRDRYPASAGFLNLRRQRHDGPDDW